MQQILQNNISREFLLTLEGEVSMYANLLFDWIVNNQTMDQPAFQFATKGQCI